MHVAAVHDNGALSVGNAVADRAEWPASWPIPKELADYNRPAALSAAAFQPANLLPDYQYAIITGSNLAGNFQPLLNEKISRGLSARS